jgi:hypothetical protein
MNLPPAPLCLLLAFNQTDMSVCMGRLPRPRIGLLEDPR